MRSPKILNLPGAEKAHKVTQPRLPGKKSTAKTMTVTERIEEIKQLVEKKKLEGLIKGVKVLIKEEGVHEGENLSTRISIKVEIENIPRTQQEKEFLDGTLADIRKLGLPFEPLYLR